MPEESVSEALQEIIQRCEAAGLECDLLRSLGASWSTDLVVRVPRGRDTSSYIIEDGLQATWAVDEPFEAYKKLKGYTASWSAKHKAIECNLVPTVSPETIHTQADKENFIRLVVNSLSGIPGGEGADVTQRIYFDSPVRCTLSVGGSSNVHAILYDAVLSRTENGEPELYVQRSLTLRIEDVAVTTHDDAVEVLERVGNSLMFQIQLSCGLSLMFERQKDVSGYWNEDGFNVGDEEEGGEVTNTFEALQPLPPIRFEYDRQPMSLYWYGKTAGEMPLLQFLAYYQVIEFYFPVYSEIEAQNTLRNILKDPTFNPMRDPDIVRLLEAIKIGSGGRTFGNEGSQLEATIRHCVTSEDLRDFFISAKAWENPYEFYGSNRYGFYTSNESKKVVKESVPLKEKAGDYRGAVAKRIYAIRNRIVHTKSGFGEVEPLFPFDPETEHLRCDIELVEFLARKVLIASSRSLQI